MQIPGSSKVLPSSSVVLFVIALILLSWSYRPVPYGTVEVVTRFGRVTHRTLQPGFNLIIPMADNTLRYRTQKITYETLDPEKSSTADYSDIPVNTTTQDGQQILIRYTIRFRIDPDKAGWVANNIGTEAQVVDKIVKTDSRIHVRNIPKSFPASDLYTGNIQGVQDQVSQVLSPLFQENGIILDEFGIRFIEFTDEYVRTIEEKQIEAEKVITEENRAKQAEFTKARRIAEAQGEAEAQRLLTQSGSDISIQLQQIEVQSKAVDKWDGILPQYMLGESTLPFLQVNPQK